MVMGGRAGLDTCYEFTLDAVHSEPNKSVHRVVHSLPVLPVSA